MAPGPFVPVIQPNRVSDHNDGKPRREGRKEKEGGKKEQGNVHYRHTDNWRCQRSNNSMPLANSN